MTERAQSSAPSIKAIAAAALAAVDSVLARWLPDGERRGHEYVARNPRRTDAKLGSFSINIEKGAWADFATDERGGDLVALVAYLEGIKQGEAAAKLAQHLNLQSCRPTPPRAQPKATGNAVLPVPADAPEPPRAHPKHGQPAQTWTYRDAAGRALFHVWRFDTTEGKQVLPLSLWRESAGMVWRWRGVGKPRPLYGLQHLTERPDAPVLVCEGEKDTEAAANLLPDWVAITSPNGSHSAAQADWTPLQGRRVLIWPDADAAGTRYVRAVAKEAHKAGAESVAVLRLQRLASLRGEALPKGWGAADAQGEGLASDALACILADPANCAAPRLDQHKSGSTDKHAAPLAKGNPFLLVTEADSGQRKPGVYYVPTVRDRQTGQQVEGAPAWVCTPLQVEALTRDATGSEWGRLLYFHDRDGAEHRWAMPCAMLAKDGAELREALLSQGLEITAGPARRYLGEYIQGAEPGRFARCVSHTGWHGGRFVLANRSIGPDDGELLVFQGGTLDNSKVAEAGSLGRWRDTVSAPCTGNTRLVLAVSAALAAPCLRLVGLEGGGLHLRGKSSCGKSTALAVAASVYGPAEYRREWRATDNALEAVAAMHCDALLPLDEIGQLEPHHAGKAAYLLSNGQGKSRSRRDGTLRAPATWRLLFLSCGEVGLGDLIAEAGGKHRAGMEVRVVDLPADADAGLGMFEHVPDATPPGRFADQLRAAAATNYGTAFPAFLEVLTDGTDAVRKALRQFMDDLTTELIDGDAAGQVRRVAQRFALIAAAGEVATLHGITGWPKGEALQAGRACFGAWLAARGGHGESEPRAMLRQVVAFIGAHSEGRFTPMDRADDDRAPKTLLRAGWRVQTENGLEHWVLPETWRNEVCKGFDAAAVARELDKRGLLQPEAPGRYSRREHIRGTGRARVYRLLPGVLDVEA